MNRKPWKTGWPPFASTGSKPKNHAFAVLGRSQVLRGGVGSGLFDVARILRACAVPVATAEPKYIAALEFQAGRLSGASRAGAITTYPGLQPKMPIAAGVPGSIGLSAETAGASSTRIAPGRSTALMSVPPLPAEKQSRSSAPTRHAENHLRPRPNESLEVTATARKSAGAPGERSAPAKTQRAARHSSPSTATQIHGRTRASTAAPSATETTASECGGVALQALQCHPVTRCRPGSVSGARSTASRLTRHAPGRPSLIATSGNARAAGFNATRTTSSTPAIQGIGGMPNTTTLCRCLLGHRKALATYLRTRSACAGDAMRPRARSLAAS